MCCHSFKSLQSTKIQFTIHLCSMGNFHTAQPCLTLFYNYEASFYVWLSLNDFYKYHGTWTHFWFVWFRTMKALLGLFTTIFNLMRYVQNVISSHFSYCTLKKLPGKYVSFPSNYVLFLKDGRITVHLRKGFWVTLSTRMNSEKFDWRPIWGFPYLPLNFWETHRQIIIQCDLML